MKSRVLKSVSVILSILMLVSILPLSGMAAEYAAGDIIEFGSYPQTEVTDSAALSALNAQSLNWVSYGYFSADDNDFVMKSRDYMKYADVSYAGNTYRAVRFTSYRPLTFYGAFGFYDSVADTYITSEDGTFQNDNGYYTDTVYWFRYEPLQWRVFDPSTGLAVSEYGIDSQPYCDRVVYATGMLYYNETGEYASDYVTSSIRKWLNTDFYYTAFSDSEKAGLYARTLDNSAIYDSVFDSASTTDKVFLLSYNDMSVSAYGFNADSYAEDDSRRVHSTDYAKCQGAYTNTNNKTRNGEDTSPWWLRTPSDRYNAARVECDGYVTSDYADNTCLAVRPAILLKPEEGNPEPDSPVKDTSFLDRIKAFFKIVIDYFKAIFDAMNVG